MGRVLWMSIAVLTFASNAVAGKAYDALSKLGEDKQKQILAQLVASSGETCSAVSKFFYIGDNDVSDQAVWTVRCGNDDFMVAVNNGGGMASTILRCDVAATVGVQCWKPF